MTPATSTPRPSRSGAGRPRNQPSTLSGTPTPKIPSSEPSRKKLRYIPGGPGGGGRYVDEDGTEIPVGGTGPGGQNYVGPRGPIGRANLAAGLTPAPSTRRERTPRPSRTTPSRSRIPTTPRFATAAHASAVMVQSEDYKPREERAMEEFHPDLDIHTMLKVFSADEVDGKISDRPITPAGVSTAADGSAKGTNGVATSGSAASSANGDITPVTTMINVKPFIYPGTPGMKRGPGRPPRDPVKFYAERAAAAAAAMGSPTGIIPTTPKAVRITPLPNQTAKERLTLPQPSYRKVSNFPKYKGETPEIEKIMVEMGYRVEDVFVRPEHRYIRTEDSMIPEGVFRVEYDMDEDDAGWLKVLNEQRKELGLDAISPEIFEITITKIELEWNALEKRIPKPNPKPPQTHRPRSSSAAAVNGEPQAGEEQDSKCAICDDGDCENTNAIVFCDGCDLAVHQDCYGVPFIPEGQWLCRKCHLIGRGIPTCLFCPNTDGAFKQTNSSKWAHLLCAMWIPEVSLGNHSFMEPVQDVEKVPKNRWELKCYICKQNMGACVQCGNRNCYEAFHVTCARKAKLYLKMKNSHGTLSVLDGTSVLKAFCHKHSPKDYQRDVDVVRTTKDAIEFYKKTMKGRIWASTPAQASAMAAKKHQKLEHPHNQSQATGARIAQVAGDKNGKKNQIIWRLDSGAPVIPKVILESVTKDMERFSIQKNEDFIAQMTRFWTLKRESRGGAPLIKRLGQNETSTAMEMTRRNFPAMGPTGRARLHRRTEFGQMIYKELNQLSTITDAYKERAKTYLELSELQEHAINLLYFPLQSLMLPAIDRVISSDCSKTYKAGLTDIKQKIQNRHYVSGIDLARDISTLIRKSTAIKPIAVVESPVDEPRTSTRKRKRSEIDEEAAKEAEKLEEDGRAIIEACNDSLIEVVTIESEIKKNDADKMIRTLKAILAGDTKATNYDSDASTIINVSARGAKTEESEEFISAANSTAGLDTDAAEEQKVTSTAESRTTATSIVPSSIQDLHDEDAEGEEVDDEDVFAPVPTGSPQTVRDPRPTKSSSDVTSHGPVETLSKDSFTPPDTNGSAGSVSSLPQVGIDPPTPASSTSPSSSASATTLADGGVMWYLKDFAPIGTSVREPLHTERDVSEELTDIDDEQLRALGGDAAVAVSGDGNGAKKDVGEGDGNGDGDVVMGGTEIKVTVPTTITVPVVGGAAKKNARTPKGKAKGKVK